MPELPLNQIICGDCVEVMRTFPSNSVDLVVTDPPYGLSFMGKDWDKTLPPQEAFNEIIRVLKPGALAFIMSSPRQDVLWRMLALLEGVGFELNQSYIEWIYKTGFPKAYDVSLGIDRKFIIEEFLEIEGRKPTKDEVKKLIIEKRKIIGKGKGTSLNYQNKINLEQGFRPNDYYEGNVGVFNITEPWHILAKEWNGWKAHTGLKPAHEPILMVNKPFSKPTIVENILKWGTGAINVDACRIPVLQEDRHEYGISGDEGDPTINAYGKYDRVMYEQHNKGRFPANLLVSDKAIDDGTIVKTHGGGKSSFGGTFGNKQEVTDKTATERFRGNSGGKSRYFDLDAWAEHHGFLDVPKPSKAERDFGLKGEKKDSNKWNQGGIGERRRQAGIGFHRNTHPTVKPIKLMAYLIELGCPPEGIVLDPFVGSGTTLIASKKLIRKFIGIDINPEYCAIAQSRVDSYPIPLSWFANAQFEKHSEE